MIDLTVIILTYNEEIHIERAINNVKGWCKYIYILDSGSTDKTITIAEQLGAKIFYRKFDNYANQRNYALNNLNIPTEWIFFLDADEYLTEELKEEITCILKNTRKNGFYIKRRFIFMGRWIKYGGYYPVKLLRLFRKGTAKVIRNINEHIDVEGQVGELQNDFIDEQLKGLTHWIEKHNRYSTLEALELIDYEKRRKNKIDDSFGKLLGTAPQRKRWIREHIWNPLMPPLIRPFLYFIYRYIFKLGFLDGKEGFIFHFLHALWFHFLIDVKYLEIKNTRS